MAIEYITYEEVLLFCKPQELPLDQEDEINTEQITKTLAFPRYEIEKVLKSAGYVVPLTEQTDIDSLMYITLPIFRYHITTNNGIRTEQILSDYANAKKELSNIKNGSILLTIPTVLDPNDSSINGLNTVTLDIW